MKITPNYSIKDTITEWTLKKLKENPKLYGGDNGNNEIILAYLKETHPFSFVHELTPETIAHSVAVSRCKNKLLQDKQYEELEHRIKNKPKNKR